MAPRSDPKDKAENFFNDDADVTDAADPEQNAEPAVEEEEELSVEDLAEINSVNQHLDSLNSALDAIEQRNDDIHAQLLELLSSNRAIRQSLQAEADASRPNKDTAERQPLPAQASATPNNVAAAVERDARSSMDELEGDMEKVMEKMAMK